MRTTPNTNPKRAQKKTANLLYQPADFFQVRAPLFPIEAYLGLSTLDAETPPLSLENPLVRQAIAVGSLSLLDELERQSLDPRAVQRRQRKLLRYCIRMATRPTPYGLFAGVALGRWGEQTNLALGEKMAQVQARPDMEWLLSFVWQLESVPEIRTHLRFVASAATYIRNGRAYVLENVASAKSDPSLVASLRATSAVKRALAIARQPIPYAELFETLLGSIQGATADKVTRLLDELWKHGMLLTDLRPAMTSMIPPAWQLQQRMASIPPLVSLAQELEGLLQEISQWEHLPHQEGATQYRQLKEKMSTFRQRAEDTIPALAASSAPDGSSTEDELIKHLAAGATNPVLQVDMCHRLAGKQLTREVANEVALMADVLARISPAPTGLTSLEAFREEFLERYGAEREVPLLELLNPHFGLGDPESKQKAGVEERYRQRLRKRNQALLEMVFLAQRERQIVIELDDERIAQLETPKPDHVSILPSLDLNVFLAARSAKALDQGDFKVILGPNFGGMQAGRTFGRFATMLGEEALDALRDLTSQEERLAPNAIWAEMVYLPYWSRSANVSLRPALRQYEIVFGACPTMKTIPLDELVIGLRGNRFYLRWPTQDAEVIVSVAHMLNPQGAPALVRFLELLPYDNTTLVNPFNWGDAANLPFLPRVQYGRCVLALAQWKITTRTRDSDLPASSPPAFESAFPIWCQTWNVPRYVYLSSADNRLLLDLENAQQRDELRREVAELKEGNSLLLEEVLPSPHEVWVDGPDGRYMVEITVPLLRCEPETRAEVDEAKRQAAPKQKLSVGRFVPEITPSLRMSPPGSTWLFMKLYCSHELQNGLIAGPLRALAHDTLNEKMADEWFFIRYADPDPHLRLRFRGDPQVLTRRLLPILCDWGNWLMNEGPCVKFVFDTYDREIERYGGLQAIELAEQLFGADSRLAAGILALQQQKTLDVETAILAAVSTDQLLSALDGSADRRRAFYHTRATNRQEIGQTFRKYGRQLLTLLGNAEQDFSMLPGGEQLLPLFKTLQKELAPVADCLSRLDAEAKLVQPLSALYSSFVHMHCNRLIGMNGQVEEQTIGLLLRTYEGLEAQHVKK